MAISTVVAMIMRKVATARIIANALRGTHHWPVLVTGCGMSGWNPVKTTFYLS